MYTMSKEMCYTLVNMDVFIIVNTISGVYHITKICKQVFESRLKINWEIFTL